MDSNLAAVYKEWIKPRGGFNGKRGRSKMEWRNQGDGLRVLIHPYPGIFITALSSKRVGRIRLRYQNILAGIVTL